MKKLTLMFLSLTFGISVFGVEPKWKVGQEVKVMGVVLIVVGISDVTGDPFFKPKSLVEAQGLKLIVMNTSKSESGCTKIAGCPSE